MICEHCGEWVDSCEGLDPDAPKVMDGTTGKRLPLHRECQFRMVAGSVGHQMGQCSCNGKVDTSEDGMTAREAAMASFEYYMMTHDCHQGRQ